MKWVIAYVAVAAVMLVGAYFLLTWTDGATDDIGDEQGALHEDAPHSLINYEVPQRRVRADADARAIARKYINEGEDNG